MKWQHAKNSINMQSMMLQSQQHSSAPPILSVYFVFITDKQNSLMPLREGVYLRANWYLFLLQEPAFEPDFEYVEFVVELALFLLFLDQRHLPTFALAKLNRTAVIKNLVLPSYTNTRSYIYIDFFIFILCRGKKCSFQCIHY